MGVVHASFVISKIMAAKKTIAVIGATGEQGKEICLKLAQGPYQLLLFGNNKKETEELVRSIHEFFPYAEVEPRDCIAEASWEADIIIPFSCSVSVNEIVEKIRPVATRKLVICIRDPQERIHSSLPDKDESMEELKKGLPYSKLVRMESMLSAPGAGLISPEDFFITGEDEEAVESVMELVRSMGLNPRIKNCN